MVVTKCTYVDIQVKPFVVIYAKITVIYATVVIIICNILITN